MEHEAWSFDEGFAIVADVHPLSDERMAGFRQMDSDLVGPTGFERALRERRSVERIEGANVRDCFTAELRVRGRPSNSVASVFDEPGRERPRRHAAVCEGDVAAVDGMVSELAPERVTRRHRAAKDDEARRLSVEPLHDAERCGASLLRRLSKQSSNDFVEWRRRVGFARVPDRRDTRRLTDDDDMGVDVDQVAFPEAHGFDGSRGRHADRDARTCGYESGRIRHDPALDSDFPRSDESPHRFPRSAELGPEGPVEWDALGLALRPRRRRHDEIGVPRNGPRAHFPVS